MRSFPLWSSLDCLLVLLLSVLRKFYCLLLQKLLVKGLPLRIAIWRNWTLVLSMMNEFDPTKDSGDIRTVFVSSFQGDRS